jgi:predicted dithiol-disulfide oxidoreductase (DUF899 family)
VTGPAIGTREEWTAARLELLAREKEWPGGGDEIGSERRLCLAEPVDAEGERVAVAGGGERS